MSVNGLRSRLVPGVVFLSGIFWAAPLYAQEPRGDEKELIDHARRMEMVAAQKMESDVRIALRDAERLARTDRTKALARLKDALAVVTDDTTLTPERRQALKRVFADRIRVTELDEPAQNAAENEKQAQAAIRKLTQEREQAERERMDQKLKRIQELKKQGKDKEAGRESAELAGKHPDEPVVQATDQSHTLGQQVADARQMQADRGKRILGAYQDLDRSSLPSNGDIEYPKDWHTRGKRRDKIPLTAKERSILQALARPVSVRFKDSRLEDVIETLRTMLGETIMIDYASLKDADATYDSPVSLNVKGVSARTVLRRVLADLGLTYVVKGEYIEVTSLQRSREMMVVRGYYIGDLVSSDVALSMFNPLTPVNGAFQLGQPAQANMQTRAMQIMQGVKTLMETIQTSIDASSWREGGGNGTISFDVGSMSIIVKQSAEVHAMLAGAGYGK